jgi:hypothetical protein
MRIVRDLLGMLMVGDGLLMALIPRRRLRRWSIGPGWWQDLGETFRERPALTRLLGFGTALLGLAIALPRQR